MKENKNPAKMNADSVGLKKHDVKVSTISFMMFSLVAAGAYGIEEMMPESGPGLTIIMLIVLPFVWGIPLGLVCSELGAVRPQEGGYYKWVQEALGEYWGFQAGWWRTVSIYIDNTLYVILAGGYVAGTWNLSQGQEMAFKVIMILIFTYINIRGLRDVGKVSAILSVLVILAFATVAICGFMNWEQNPMEPITADGTIMGFSGVAFADWIYYIGMGIAIGMWMYSGYESLSTFAGEVKDPQVIPKGISIAVPMVMCVYIFPTIAGLATLTDEKAAKLLGDAYQGGPAWQYWGTETGTIGYADVITVNWGPALGIVFVIIAVLAQCSIYNSYIISGSRGFFALAEDHLAPPMFVKCDKKHGVPYVSVISVAVVNIILCQLAFDVAVVVDVFLLVSAYIMICISALILRRKIPEAERKKEGNFRIPGGYAFLLLLCIVPIAIAFFAFFINGTDYFIGGMVGIVSGPIMYIIWKLMYGGLSKKDAKAYPINPKTRLAIGDTKRIAVNFLILAVMGGIAWPWLMWFEGPWYGDWGAEYYAETYSSGITKTLFGSFDGMLNAILIATIAFAIIAIVMFAISAKIEPKKYEILKDNH